VTFTASSSTPGSYTVTVTGVSGSLTRTTTVSVTVTAPPPPSTAPGAPTNLRATAGNASVSLAWTAPSSNGGSAITNYRVYRRIGSGTETLYTTLGNVTSYTDTPLTNGTTYYYRVVAVNSVGPGPYSNQASATPAAAPAPCNGNCQG
jgi:predicted phage tail protein